MHFLHCTMKCISSGIEERVLGMREGSMEGRDIPLFGTGLLVLIILRKQCITFHLREKSDFNNEVPLKGYDNQKEEWPKCKHGEDFLM